MVPCVFMFCISNLFLLLVVYPLVSYVNTFSPIIFASFVQQEYTNVCVITAFNFSCELCSHVLFSCVNSCCFSFIVVLVLFHSSSFLVLPSSFFCLFRWGSRDPPRGPRHRSARVFLGRDPGVDVGRPAKTRISMTRTLGWMWGARPRRAFL